MALRHVLPGDRKKGYFKPAIIRGDWGLTTVNNGFSSSQRIREACSSGDPLLGRVVEIDETYIGGKGKDQHEHKKLNSGRGPVGKQAVMGMREREGKTLHEEIHASVQGSAVVYTDDFRAYIGIVALPRLRKI